MKKVMVGMSGGVDSSVSALLLREQGYDVMGITMKLFSDEDIVQAEKDGKTCCALSDVEDARSVAYRLGFEHLVFNFKDSFRECVMKKFVSSYLNGHTPNPCIDCNKYIKFDRMLRRALELDYDYIATGHYAINEYDEKTGRYLLKRPKDRSKDQTYFLYSLTQEQLKHTLFPLGNLEKSEVREIAEKASLVNSKKPDSQDICFVPDGNYVSFIEKFTGKNVPRGTFVDMNGKILGEHKGIINYTIGQRKGLGISLGKPAYVIKKDISTNTVTLGDKDDLKTLSFIVENVNLISVPELKSASFFLIKTRYSQYGEYGLVTPIGNNECKITFETPQKSVASGQAVVFYDGDIVVGGGTAK
ncbi:MAG: tRNA 2-thiouridine(34) synthase MnmA [Ruminococcus sp.]|nr:tRNA 2-thiouridine(34) synthase MnmA [Ruminococcus sp.]